LELVVSIKYRTKILGVIKRFAMPRKDA